MENEPTISPGPHDYPGYHAPGPPPLPAPGPQSQWVPPQAVLGYAIPQQSLRPTSATVIAIIGICYAGLEILGYLLMLGSMLMVASFVGAGVTPFFTHQMIAWTIARGALGLGVAGFLLAASIGLLRAARWSRRGMVYYAVADLVLAVGWAAVDVLIIMPEQQRQFAAMGLAAAGPGSYGQYVGKVIWLLVSAAFPVVVLVFMMRPNVRDFYDGPK